MKNYSDFLGLSRGKLIQLNYRVGIDLVWVGTEGDVDGSETVSQKLVSCSLDERNKNV